MATAINFRTAKPYLWYKAVTADLASINAGDTVEQSFTIGAALPNDWIEVQAKDLEADLILGQAWCATQGTVKVRIANPTVNPIDAASQDFHFICR